MKTNPALITAFILAVFLAGAMSWRIWDKQKKFEAMVKESLKTSEGYDQKFIALVNKLEDVLATRASFGYTGDKDPMTGKVRKVVKAKVKKKKKGKKKEPEKQIDPVRLTAIIADDTETEYTAIIMDGDRSQSISVGDKVKARSVIKITADEVYMEDDSLMYKYDISGKKFKRRKNIDNPEAEKPEEAVTDEKE